MKTLEEIENEVKIVSNAFVLVALSKKRDQPDALVTANGKQADLFTSLAQWDAILQECVPELRQEIKSLEWMQNTRNEEDLSEDCGLNHAGLARLEYLRELLGEGEEG